MNNKVQVSLNKNMYSKALKFGFSLLLFSLLLAAIIYFRESDVQEQVSLVRVIFWQLAIWLPWVAVYAIVDFWKSTLMIHKVKIILAGVIFLFLHFGWFFLLSLNWSPYLDLPATRYGVYPYFFIFWIMVDLVVAWNLFRDMLSGANLENEIKFELKRGDKKYYCTPESIYWIEADNYYSEFHTEYGIFLVRQPLKDIYAKLSDHNFLRIHRSSIVNRSYMIGVQRNKASGVDLILKDGTIRKISKAYASEVRKSLIEG